MALLGTLWAASVSAQGTPPAAPPNAASSAQPSAPQGNDDGGWTSAPDEGSEAPPASSKDAVAPDARELEKRLEALSARVEAQERELEAQRAELEARQSGGASGELDALLREVGDVNASEYAAPEPLLLYGFADFGFNQIFTRADNSLLATLPAARSSFVVGNINLFLDAHPMKNVRSLVELRFTNLPHGDERSLAPYVRQDTRAVDVTDPSARRRVVVGSVILERAYAQYSPTDEFQLLVGQFFTPFGIWNVDHANPTLISLLLPIAQVDQFFPDRLVGLQAQGTFHLKGGVDFGYHVHLSNGRTESLMDFTAQKAVGGRVHLSAPAARTPWKVGLSGYTGELNDRVKRIESLAPLSILEDFVVRGHEWAGGADASLDWGPLRLRSEGVLRRITYEEGKRPDRGGGMYAPDRYAWDTYALAAYRLPWLGLEPYLWFEVMHEPNSFGDTVYVPSAGLNIHFSPAVLLKSQFAHVMFADTVMESTRDPSQYNLSYITSRFVVSF
jgi:hypothetical protein